ncbi:unnamed protein product [Rhodiola kirilowii]
MQKHVRNRRHEKFETHYGQNPVMIASFKQLGTCSTSPLSRAQYAHKKEYKTLSGSTSHISPSKSPFMTMSEASTSLISRSAGFLFEIHSKGNTMSPMTQMKLHELLGRQMEADILDSFHMGD